MHAWVGGWAFLAPAAAWSPYVLTLPASRCPFLQCPTCPLVPPVCLQGASVRGADRHLRGSGPHFCDGGAAQVRRRQQESQGGPAAACLLCLLCMHSMPWSASDCCVCWWGELCPGSAAGGRCPQQPGAGGSPVPARRCRAPAAAAARVHCGAAAAASPMRGINSDVSTGWITTRHKMADGREVGSMHRSGPQWQ